MTYYRETPPGGPHDIPCPTCGALIHWWCRGQGGSVPTLDCPARVEKFVELRDAAVAAEILKTIPLGAAGRI